MQKINNTGGTSMAIAMQPLKRKPLLTLALYMSEAKPSEM